MKSGKEGVILGTRAEVVEEVRGMAEADARPSRADRVNVVSFMMVFRCEFGGNADRVVLCFSR